MAFWPLQSGPVIYDYGSMPTSLPASATTTASSTVNQKGSWTQVIASTPSEWEGFWVSIQAGFVSATDTSTLMDIGFGGAGAEVVQIANLPVGYTAATGTGNGRFIPLRVPAGTRISARTQSVVASKTLTVIIYGQGGRQMAGSVCPQLCTTYGTTLATSIGTAVTSSGTANAFGNWSVLSTSTTAPIHQVLVGVQGNNSANVTAANIGIQLGVGASGQEAALPFQIFTICNASEWYEFSRYPHGFIVPFTGLSVPAGSRLSARMSTSVATQVIDLTVLGFTQ